MCWGGGGEWLGGGVMECYTVTLRVEERNAKSSQFTYSLFGTLMVLVCFVAIRPI